MAGSLEGTFVQLDANDPTAASYISARRSGFNVVGRIVVYESRGLSARLRLSKGPVERELYSESREWLRCALAHFQTNNGFFLPGEEGYPLDNLTVPRFPTGEVSISFRAGSTALEADDISYLEIREELDLKRVYRLWASAVKIVPLTPALTTAYVELLLRVDGHAAISSFRGHVDSVRPFEYQGQAAVEVAGSDILTGSQVLIRARYNFQVDPRQSVIGFSRWVEPEVLAKGTFSTPDLAELESFARHGVPGQRFNEFIAALRRIEERDGRLATLSRYFIDSLSASDPMLLWAALSFRKAAEILTNNLQVYVVIGSVKGANPSGIGRIGPGIVIASSKHIPFRLRGGDPAEELCELWTREAARLVTYFAVDDVASTRAKGWAALKSAFDYLNFAICDAGWCHLEGDASLRVLELDVHQQDAMLELERWYHVHHLISGVAHQYQNGIC